MRYVRRSGGNRGLSDNVGNVGLRRSGGNRVEEGKDGKGREIGIRNMRKVEQRK
ncbi:MAG: hypothetical protein ABIH92_00425 [Nanoarchaeota archaeon]